MIKGTDTNCLYLSELLQKDYRFSNTCEQIISKLGNDITVKFLKGTNDVWCRDYMPIEINEYSFIQFRYDPYYLEEDPDHKTDIKTVGKSNGFDPSFSKINLDGGNLVNWSNKAIVSDRVYQENPEYSNKSQLIGELEQLLEVEVIVIPQLNSDIYGHADSMVRFVNESTLIGNDLDQEYLYWKKGMLKVLRDHNLDYINVPFMVHKDYLNPESAIGCYINYLELGNLVLLPIFEVKGNHDQKVIDIFHKTFPERTIISININEIAKYGGLLNCISWTIKN